jgi:hypothetical protein
MVALSVFYVIMSFTGCAGGYRQDYRILLIYSGLVTILTTLQLTLGGMSVHHLKNLEQISDSFWYNASGPQKDFWMLDYKCCNYDGDDFQCSDDVYNDCKPLIVNYLSGQSSFLATLFFCLAAVSLTATIVSLLWALGLFTRKMYPNTPDSTKESFESRKPFKRPAIRSKEDFERYILDNPTL